VGEIFDEYDTDAATAVLEGSGGDRRRPPQPAGLPRHHRHRAPRGSSDTVGGFVIEQLGRLARVGDKIEVDGHVLTVTALDRRRIDQVLVSPERVTSDEASVSAPSVGPSA